MKMIKNMGIRQRIILSYLMILFILILSGSIQYIKLRTIGSYAKTVSEVNLVNLTNLAKAETAAHNAAFYLEKLNSKDLTAKSFEEISLYLNEAESDFEKYLEMYDSIATSNEEKNVLQQIKTVWQSPKSKFEKIRTSLTSGAVSAYEEFKKSPPYQTENEFAPVYEQISKLTQMQNDSGFSLSQTIRKESKFSEAASVVLILLGILCCLTIGFILSKSIEKNLNHIAEIANENTHSLKNSVHEILDSSAVLASGVEQQSAALQASASALTEISTMVSRVSDESIQSLQYAKQGESLTSQGRSAVKDVTECLEEVFDSVRGVIVEMENNNQKTSDILATLKLVYQKTKVIDEIVFQTKLLSFNASVEAARAGEFGKGFSVVAEEVGRLAKHSGSAAIEINQILQKSFEQVEKIVQSSNESANKWRKLAQDKMDKGLTRGRLSADVLDQLIAVSQEITSRADEVSTAIKEQQKGITDINKTINELDQISKKTKSTAGNNQQIAYKIQSESDRSAESLTVLESFVYGDTNKKAQQKKAA